MERPFSADSMYTYPNGVIKNKLNIKNINELNEKENQITNKPIKIENFNKQQFINLHKNLYQDLYAFAGKLRDENVSMYNIVMCHHQIIDLCLTNLFEQQIKINNTKDACKFLAYFYSELNIICPFRDGNKKTIEIFLEKWLLKLHYKIDFNNIDEKTLTENLIYSFYNDTSKLITLFKSHIKKID